MRKINSPQLIRPSLSTLTTLLPGLLTGLALSGCGEDPGGADSVTSLGVSTNYEESEADSSDEAGSTAADSTASQGDGDDDGDSADTGTGTATTTATSTATATDTGTDTGFGETGDATQGGDSFDSGLDSGLDTGFDTGFETGVTETGPFTETGEDPDCVGDGDGDGDGDDGGFIPDPDCEAPEVYDICDGVDDDPFHAIGLNCSDDASTTIPLMNTSFTASDALSWKVARSYGSGLDCDEEPIWVPHEGQKFLMISTGQLAEPDAMTGNITLVESSTQPGVDTNANPDDVQLPMPLSPLNGSGGTPGMDCDGSNDCSDTLQAQWELGGSAANDLLYFEFEAVVPVGVEGYSFEMAWFSSEYSEYVNTTYNDIFLVWVDSDQYTGNMSSIDEQPMTVTALAPYMTYEQNSPRLAGTGFEGVGGSTGWIKARGIATPGETIKLVFAIFDMGDSIYDTTAIIDNFRWECEGCDPTIPGDCGVLPE